MYCMPVDPMTANLQHEYCKFFDFLLVLMSMHDLAEKCICEGIFLATPVQGTGCACSSPVFNDFAHAMLCSTLICHISCIDQGDDLIAHSSFADLA